MFLSYFVIVFLTYFWSAMGQDSVQPCFSAFVSTSIPPTSSIQCNQLYDCLQSCLSNPICKSILWDDSKYFCYHFSQTARVNPTILLNKFGTAYYERSSACGGFTQAPVIASSGSPVASSCPGGTSIAYFLATSVELTAIGGSAVPYTKEDDCLSSCTRQTSVGGGAALTCQSMNINVKTKTCQISASNGPPDGSGTLSPNPDAIYVQKFCLPAGAPSACNEQFFFLFPSNSFDGHTISTAKATSTVDCAGQCSTTASCQAGVFDTASKDCTLKNSNAKASPADLKPGTATSNYFEKWLPFADTNCSS